METQLNIESDEAYALAAEIRARTGCFACTGANS
jgi:hypothetical protein